MKSMSVLIKPSSSNCNMRCKYCFYFDETDNREVASYGFMQQETMQNLIDFVLGNATHSCNFAFQGGEPTVIGIGFFKNFVDYVKKQNTKQLTINYSIQTNGYLINAEWAKFFSENKFLLGLSLDGTKEVNDFNRIDTNGVGTFNKIMKATQLLNANKVEYNILTVVTKQSAKNVEKIYNFFKKNNFAWQQYIPCIDPIGVQRGGNNYSITPEIYAGFLKKLFDSYYIDFKNGKRVSVRYFDNIITMLAGMPPETCGMLGFCTNQYVVEADGGVYPCDFYMLDSYRLGNINTDSLQALDAKREEIGFIQKSLQVDDDCKKCKWMPICRGGCRRDRDNFGNATLSKTYLCEAYTAFYEHAYPRLCEIANILVNEQRRR